MIGAIYEKYKFDIGHASINFQHGDNMMVTVTDQTLFHERRIVEESVT